MSPLESDCERVAARTVAELEDGVGSWFQPHAGRLASGNGVFAAT
jgi:hypothetical protein